MKKICVVVALAGLASVANASLVTSRGALGGTDFIEWGQFGGDFTPVASGSGGLTNLGMGFTVHGPSTMERRNQGTGWAGNFAQGDRLLWTRDTPGAMTIVFSSAIGAVGAQIQRDAYGSFTGEIAVYDINNILLESYAVGGTSNGNGDNSAIFIGIDRAQNDIVRVVFNVDGGREDFAVNQVDIRPVPTPGSLALVSAAGLLAARRRRKA